MALRVRGSTPPKVRVGYLLRVPGLYLSQLAPLTEDRRHPVNRYTNTTMSQAYPVLKATFGIHADPCNGIGTRPGSLWHVSATLLPVASRQVIGSIRATFT
jgi:hypothetical protein